MKTIQKTIIAVTGLLTIFILSNMAFSQECGNTVLCGKFVKQSVDLSMSPEATQTVLVRFKNAGSAAWSNANISLQYADSRVNPQNNNVWGNNNIPMNVSSVIVGDDVMFEFTITAPVKQGAYNFQWQMVSNGTSFGSTSPSTEIKVQ